MTEKNRLLFWRCYRAHNLESAGIFLDRLKKTSNGDREQNALFRLRVQFGEQSLEAKLPSMARWHAIRALELERRSSEVWALRIRAEVELQRYSEALSSIDQAIELKPQNTELLRTEVMILQKLGRHEEAARLNHEFRGIPYRPDNAKPEFVDLSPLYNATLTNSWHGVEENDISELEPLGIKRLEMVDLEFDVRGAVHLNNRAGWSTEAPASVEGIRVGRECHKSIFCILRVGEMVKRRRMLAATSWTTVMARRKLKR